MFAIYKALTDSLQLCSPNLVSKYLRLQHLQASIHPERCPTHRYRLPNDGPCRSPAHRGRGPHGWGTPRHATCPVPNHHLQRHHPSFPTVSADSGPRSMKQTLRRRYYAQVKSFTGEDEAIADAAAAREAIHRTAVEESIRAGGINSPGHACPNHQLGGGRTIEEDQAHPVSIEVRFLSRT